jgi:hypothetical protein
MEKSIEREPVELNDAELAVSLEDLVLGALAWRYQILATLIP